MKRTTTRNDVLLIRNGEIEEIVSDKNTIATNRIPQLQKIKREKVNVAPIKYIFAIPVIFVKDRTLKDGIYYQLLIFPVQRPHTPGTPDRRSEPGTTI